MTLAITHRTSFQEATGGRSSFTTSSFTPAANSKLYAYVWSQGGGTMSISSSPSLTWTQKAVSGPFGGGNARIAMWETDIGGSPASMTVTFSFASGTGDMAGEAFDVTGTSPAIVSGQIAVTIMGAGATVTSASLPATTTSGNLVVLAEGSNRDSATAPSVPASFTSLAGQVNGGGGAFQIPRVSYSTASAVTSVSHSNSPDNLDTGTVLFEVAESGGGGGAARVPAKVYNRAAIVRASFY